MKKIPSILFSLLLVLSVILQGAGVNKYRFCCDDCKTEWLSVITNDKCCEIHHHHHLGGLVTHYEFSQQEHPNAIASSDEECSVSHSSVFWENFRPENPRLQSLAPVVTLDFLLSEVPATPLLVDNSAYLSLFSPRLHQHLPQDTYFHTLCSLII